MRRWLLAGAALAVIALAGYVFLIRSGGEDEPDARPRAAVAVIGEGDAAIAVAADGSIVSRRPPEDAALPRLPTVEVPRSGRLGGTMLQQARVLGAAPPALRPHIESSSYGESGVDVELRSGIELRFGDAANAAAKWRAAAAVLADPSITSPDYVDLHAPSRPAVGDSGEPLPPAP